MLWAVNLEHQFIHDIHAAIYSDKESGDKSNIVIKDGILNKLPLESACHVLL